MKCIEIEGKNVDTAIENALEKLNVDRNRVEVQILDEGNKGFLKFGARPAKVKVTVKRDSILEAKAFLTDVLEKMNVKAEVFVTEEKDNLKIDLKGDDMGIIIGYRGETLDSLQYLVSIVVNKGHEGEYKRVVLDTENYRAKREEKLKSLAIKLAHRVAKTKKAFRLEPMNPYERRIIHATLQEDRYVDTYSEGAEPYRRVVIEVKRDRKSRG